MDNSKLSQDDFDDVVEMTKKIRDVVDQLFEENEANLCLSALYTVAINSTLIYSENMSEILTYRQAFIGMMDNSIREMRETP